MIPRLFTELQASYFRSHAGAAYRPSNGTEGEMFCANWCGRCALNDNWSAWLDPDELTGCDIIAKSMFYDVGEPGYPPELIIASDGQPMCSAFLWPGETPRTPRCPRTSDMFAGADI